MVRMFFLFPVSIWNSKFLEGDATIRSKWEEFIVVGRYSLFLEFEFSRSALFLHFNLKNCVDYKVKAFPGLFDWPMQSSDTSAIT